MTELPSEPPRGDERGAAASPPPLLQPVDFDPFAGEPVAAAAVSRHALTPPQREVLAAVQMGPHAQCAFNLCYVLHLAGPLSAVSMRQAMQRVVDRHAALRMCVSPDDHEQVIHERLVADLPHVDLSGLEPAAQQQALAELQAQETGTPFDLHVAPLWRAQVLSWAADRHALVLSVHHLASDGWSSSVLFGDLARAYAAERFGMTPQWPAALAYEDYLAWQGSAESQARQRESLAWWAVCHRDPAAPIALPTDHARPPLKTYPCRTAVLPIEPTLATAVRKLGARHGCTPFATLLAVFAGQLARLSGSRDLVIGVPMAAQALLDHGHVIAHGAHTVPLRLEVDVERPFADHLAAVRRALLDAQAHQEAGFGQLVRELSLPRDPSRTPLVDVLFNVDRLGAPFDFGELRLERVDTPKAFMNAELWLDVVDDGQALTLHGACRESLYEPDTLRRWLHAFRHALARLVDDPALPLAVACAPAGDEQAQLDRFNATRRAVDDRARLEVLVQRQAERTPRAVALRCEDRVLSYAELDARANGVAFALQAEGVAPGDRVGLFCGRHEGMVVGVLGILKAGAAYVPLDPAYPDERLVFMAEDAQLRLVACDAQTEAGWPVPAGRRLRLDDCPPRAQAPALPAADDAPAYVIYTSGSTGRPKGVVVRHRSVVNFLDSVVRVPGLSAEDRMAAVAPLSFDISVFDLFAPLSVGASVVLVTRAEARDGLALSRRLADSGATLMQATPTTWRLLIDAGWQACSGFRAFSGGEALAPELARALQQRGAEVWNFYGPTETTVYSTCGAVGEVADGVRIGRPIANTSVHVLDERLRPLPLGAVGEICIGGDGVAVGYHGRPELTAERFVADPRHAGQRLYRTGDRGRWHGDGTLECLGRIDHQVKLRGHRIEPGEIEAVLLRQPGVRGALVVLRAERPAEEHLVAYVVGDTPDPRALREALRRQLPEVMLPRHVVPIEAWPLLPNGKIDRQALPPPQATPAPAAMPAADALDGPEAVVAAIWRRLLGVADVRASDNFFDLGGHSMLAARAAQEMQQALGHPVGVPRLVMETLEQLARPSAGAAGKLPELPREGGWWRRWVGARRGG